MKHGKSFSDGEMAKECLLIAAEEMASIEDMANISLSRSAVTERVEEIGDDLKLQLKNLCTKFVYFSLALDESNDVVDTAQLSVYIRGVTAELEIFEELLELVPCHDTSTGADIFERVDFLFDEFNLQWDRLSSVSTDGASALTGVHKGLKALILQRLAELGLPPIPFIHCIIHREQLCIKSLGMKDVMSVVVQVVNFIRARGLKHREFRSILEDIGSEYDDIPYYCAVRFLSRGKTLVRFIELRDVIQKFVEDKGLHVPEFNDNSWWQKLGFWADLCTHLNKLNVSLQGKVKVVTEMRDNISAFKKKLLLFKMQLSRRVFDSFPSLKLFCSEDEPCSDLSTFVGYLDTLSKEFSRRFMDLDTLCENFDIFTAPYRADPFNLKLGGNLATELIELQSNSTLEKDEKRLHITEFWTKVAQTKQFPELCMFVAKVLSMFTTTYVCETSFSLMKLIKSRFRTRLSDEHLAAALRIMSSQKLKPNLSRLIENRKRFQVSSSASST